MSREKYYEDAVRRIKSLRELESDMKSRGNISGFQESHALRFIYFPFEGAPDIAHDGMLISIITKTTHICYIFDIIYHATIYTQITILLLATILPMNTYLPDST